jgi:hypothetical protein
MQFFTAVCRHHDSAGGGKLQECGSHFAAVEPNSNHPSVLGRDGNWAAAGDRGM